VARLGSGWRSVGGVCVVALWTGCAESPAQPESEPRFGIGGTYLGPVTGETEAGTLDAQLALFVAHDDGHLSGTYAIQGQITFGDLGAFIFGDGTHVGTIYSGSRPSLALMLQNALCPDHEGELGGRFDPVTGGLELRGTLDVLGPDCQVLVSYQSSAYLDRSGDTP